MDPIPSNVEIKTSTKKLDLNYESQSAEIELISNVAWTAIKQGNSAWLTISPESGAASDDVQKIKFTVTNNTDTKKARTAMVTFVSKVGNGIDTVTIVQGPKVDHPELYKDQLVLEKLYAATKGYQWTLVWDLDADITSWYGVKTGMVDGALRVTELVLDHGGLRGKLPEEMGELTGLEKLVIRASVLNQELPLWVTKLPNLKFLALPENVISGTIPEAYYDMVNLTRMDLNGNNLEGGISEKIGQLTKLETVALAYNPLGGTIPSTIGNLKNCYEINLSGCKLTGSIPTEIGNCTSLSAFLAENNSLTGSIPSSLSRCSDFEVLFLGYNKLTGTIPSELSQCTKFADFRFDSNEITGSLPESFSTLDSLHIINGKNNKLTGTIPASYDKLKKLNALLLTQNEISGELPDFLANLQYVYLDSNKITGSIPRAIYMSEKINFLHLADNQLVMELPVEIFQRVNLAELNLAGNIGITGEFIADGTEGGDMSDMKGLTQLILTGCKMSGTIPSKLFNNNIAKCHLEGNDFTGNLPATIASCQTLSSLKVSGNKLSGVVPEGITKHSQWTNWLPGVNILPQQNGFGLTVQQ
ncbi:MAG: BACON domain-containing protein [Marinifilaceae bacterium]